MNLRISAMLMAISIVSTVKWGNFARRRVCNFCDLAKFAKYLLHEIFSPKQYKANLERVHELLLRIFPAIQYNIVN